MFTRVVTATKASCHPAHNFSHDSWLARLAPLQLGTLTPPGPQICIKRVASPLVLSNQRDAKARTWPFHRDTSAFRVAPCLHSLLASIQHSLPPPLSARASRRHFRACRKPPPHRQHVSDHDKWTHLNFVPRTRIAGLICLVPVATP